MQVESNEEWKMLNRSEIYRLVNDYIGVHNGYLGDFSYRTHYEFYPYYCDLDIDVNDYEPGTTREKFIHILEDVGPVEQAKIIEGVLKKYPVSCFPEAERELKQTLHNEFQQVIERIRSQYGSRVGVKGEVKNLIFAANGPKPEIVLADSVSNEIEIVANAQYCLVYDLPIPTAGLSWLNLVEWWAKFRSLPFPSQATEYNLYYRLESSLASPPEKLLFRTYFKKLRRKLDSNFPALIPQVYLHYDPKTLKDLQGQKRLERQRMDFLLLLAQQVRVVIEVDGKQHYTSDGGKPSPKKYAAMMATDRKLKLAGYELYRFGGYELSVDNGVQLVEQFFRDLFQKYEIAG